MTAAGCYYKMTPHSWYYAKLTAFSAFPFVPLVVPVSYYAGVPWLAPAFAFVGIPVLDLLIGADRTRPLESRAPRPAIGCARMYGQGRVFYSTLGHTEEAWNDPDIRKMYFEAIRWVLGMTEGSTASHPPPQSPGDQHQPLR